MKKIKSIPVYLLLFVLSSMFVVSCSDDKIVTPPVGPYQFDSARYNWTADTLRGLYISRLLVIDTNSIYLTDNNNLIYYDGSKYTFHYSGLGNFRGVGLAGLNDKNIYLCGGIETIVNGGFFSKPALNRWNGSSFEIINIPEVESISDWVASNYVKSDNEIWAGTRKGKIFKFDGFSNFEFYRPVDTTFSINFIASYNNEIYVGAERADYDSSGNYFKFHLSIFKYFNQDWINVFYEEYNTNEYSYILKAFGNKIYGIKEYDGIYEFNGNDFIKIFNINEFEFYQSAQLNGNLPFDLMVANSNMLYHWNGSKWSKELGEFSGLGFPWNVSIYKDKYYCLYETGTIQDGYFLFKGIRK